MAAPDQSPSELAQIIHDNDAGFTLGPFTLTGKVVTPYVGQDGRLLVVATATRQTNTWTATYTTQRDGTLGRVYLVVDQDGVEWRNDYVSGWVAG